MRDEAEGERPLRDTSLIDLISTVDRAGPTRSGNPLAAAGIVWSPSVSVQNRPRARTSSITPMADLARRATLLRSGHRSPTATFPRCDLAGAQQRRHSQPKSPHVD